MAEKTTEMVPTRLIAADYGRNVRQPWKYKVVPKENFDAAKDVPGFYEDIFLNGVRNDIEVARLTEDQGLALQKKLGLSFVPQFRVIRGHRRFKAVQMIREKFPEMFEQLRCDVYTGLTEKAEIVMMCDHSGTEPLNEFEEYLSVERLFGTGLSQEAIGTQIGRGRAWVQDRIYILELSNYIPGFKDNYSTSFEPDKKAGEHYVKFTMKNVDELHKLWGEDTALGIPFEDPRSKTAARWKEIATKTDKTPPATKALTRAEMDKRSGLLKGREALEIAHGFYNGDGRQIMDAIDLYDALVASANKVPGLEAVILEHEETIKSLRIQLEEAKASAAEMVANHALAIAKVDELTEANAKLTEQNLFLDGELKKLANGNKARAKN